MLFEIVSFLLDVVVGLISGASLLRMYMQAQRVPFSNPVGQLVFALSDWIVLPLRKVMSSKGRWDMPSLLAALLLQFVEVLLVWLLLGAKGALLALPWLALCGLVKVALSGLMGILLVYAILSWVQPYSPIYGVLQRLSDPLVAPIRRFVPLIGNVDFSALIGLIALQVLLMVLNYVQAAGLMVIAQSSL
ncbi:MAG: YggT family protein [Comamonas sp.]|nr:YggT family protein [Comamonas sp.]